MYKDIIDAYYIGYNAADETKHLYFTFHKTICCIEKDAMSIMKVEMILKIMRSINIYHWRVPKNKKKYEIKLNIFLNRTMMTMQIMGKITI